MIRLVRTDWVVGLAPGSARMCLASVTLSPSQRQAGEHPDVHSALSCRRILGSCSTMLVRREIVDMLAKRRAVAAADPPDP